MKPVPDHSRAAMQQVPQVTMVDVERVVRRDYPPSRFGHVTAILAEYIDEEDADGTARILLAALKLADGNEAHLRHEIAEAKVDFRDVVAPAEYPGYLREVRPGVEVTAERRHDIIDRDWKQYHEWLHRD